MAFYQQGIFNQVKSNTAILVTWGFFHGAHLGYLHWDEAERELEQCINPDKENAIPFQLSACTITVPIMDGKLDRFSFPAVVIETSV
jgi:hypothetical protein